MDNAFLDDAASSNRPVLSLIVPLYNEVTAIPVFLHRIVPVLEAIGASWELLFVDDGSSDGSAAALLAARREEPRIRLVSFARNFGKEAALTAGLDYARGEAVIPIDIDLQDPPELIPALVEAWRNGFKIVNAVRRTRHEDSTAKRLSATLFYRLFNRLSRTSIPSNAGDFRLLDGEVVRTLRTMRERSRFMKGLVAWPGYSQTEIAFDRPARATGETKWSFWSLWRFALDGIASFSTVPLRIWSYVGALVALVGFLYALVLVVRTLVYGIDVPGYASLMVMLLFLGGVQLISLGVIAGYVGRIFEETKQRPIYVVAATHGIGADR